MRLVLGRDADVAEWVGRRIAHVGSGAAFGPCAAIGVATEDGSLIGGVVFSNWQPACRSIEASFASETPRWLTRRIIGGILAYPFGQLGCQRMTAITPRKARAARRFLDAFGFKREGLVRKGFGDDDAVISGMLKREWEASRWVRSGDDRDSHSAPAAVPESEECGEP
jgi:RimJ/RimL family protein N-acetyltransferase